MSWGLSSERRRISCSPFENPEFARRKKGTSGGSADVDKGCRITAWALHGEEPGHKARCPACLPPSLPSSPPPTSSNMTSSLGRAEAPQAVLLPICSCLSCLSSYLGLHYKEDLYGALKGSSHSLLFLALASRFVEANSCIQRVFYPELFVCTRVLSSLLPPTPIFCLLVCFFRRRACYLCIRISSASF